MGADCTSHNTDSMAYPSPPMTKSETSGELPSPNQADAQSSAGTSPQVQSIETPVYSDQSNTTSPTSADKSLPSPALQQKPSTAQTTASPPTETVSVARSPSKAASATPATTSAAAPPVKTHFRPHVLVSCEPCKKAHVKCQQKRPCERCVRRGICTECIDVVHKERGRPPKETHKNKQKKLQHQSSSEDNASSYGQQYMRRPYIPLAASGYPEHQHSQPPAIRYENSRPDNPPPHQVYQWPTPTSTASQPQTPSFHPQDGSYFQDPLHGAKSRVGPIRRQDSAYFAQERDHHESRYQHHHDPYQRYGPTLQPPRSDFPYQRKPVPMEPGRDADESHALRGIELSRKPSTDFRPAPPPPGHEERIKLPPLISPEAFGHGPSSRFEPTIREREQRDHPMTSGPYPHERSEHHKPPHPYYEPPRDYPNQANSHEAGRHYGPPPPQRHEHYGPSDQPRTSIPSHDDRRQAPSGPPPSHPPSNYSLPSLASVAGGAPDRHDDRYDPVRGADRRYDHYSSEQARYVGSKEDSRFHSHPSHPRYDSQSPERQHHEGYHSHHPHRSVEGRDPREADRRPHSREEYERKQSYRFEHGPPPPPAERSYSHASLPRARTYSERASPVKEMLLSRHASRDARDPRELERMEWERHQSIEEQARKRGRIGIAEIVG